MKPATAASGLVFLLALTSAVSAAPKPGDRLSFVSCPIVRDTRTVPCWLAEYEGQTWFLTLQTDVSAPVNPPWLGHKVLVEGVVSAREPVCGGRVIEPVTLSVLPELDASCNTLLPAEDRYELGFEPPRPPGPSRGRLAFGDPNARSASSGDVPSPQAPRDFTLSYEFDGMVAFRHAQALQRILDSARAAKATQLRITGYRSASRLSNGTVMRERESIARERAEQVRDLLRGAGLEGVDYRLAWKDLSKRPDGVADAAGRRVEVHVVRADEPGDPAAEGVIRSGTEIGPISGMPLILSSPQTSKCRVCASNSSSAMRSSCRASAMPAHMCGPRPKARCCRMLGRRRRNWSGSSNTDSSRLAEAYTKAIGSPGRMRRPWISTSCRAERAKPR